MTVSSFHSRKGITLYVAPYGADTNPGTKVEPFASLFRAKGAVRSLKKTACGPITVVVREGVYYLEEPLVFTPEDSGSVTASVTYKAYPGEKPTLSGGRLLNCVWKPFRDRIWMCRFPEFETGELNPSQIFVNGKRQRRARYPNGAYADLNPKCYVSAKGADNWPHREIYYDLKTFTKKRYATPEDGVLHIFPKNYWGNMQYQVQGIDRDRNAVLLGKGGWQLNTVFQGEKATGIDDRSKFFVENVFEELDSPGEWYFNKKECVLYYIPPEQVDLQTACVEVPQLQVLVKFNGSMDHPVHHISLEGFRFAHSEATYFELYEAPSLGDWTIVRKGMVCTEGAEDCNIRKCFFDAGGGNGVFINKYAQRIHVSNNIFSEMGDSAICLVGKSHLRRDLKYDCLYCGTTHDWGWDPPSKEVPSECKIHNNLIHDIGIIGKQTAGVFLSLTLENSVSHNHIFNTPRAAICVNDGLWGGHIIEYNDIHDTCRETNDHGPFNSWGRDRFWCKSQSHGPESHPAGDVKADARFTTIIRNNRFRDQSGWGIDLDDGSSNYHVYNNLCIGIGIKLREGDYRTIENNIFVNVANPPGFHVGYEGNHDRFRRNIVVMNALHAHSEKDIDFETDNVVGRVLCIIRPPRQGSWFKEWDNNLYFSDRGEFQGAAIFFHSGRQITKVYTIEEWRAKGFDLDSVFADPMFLDPDNDNYRVKPESPALKLGFKNFNMEEFGLTADFPITWIGVRQKTKIILDKKNLKLEGRRRTPSSTFISELKNS